ncbi:MAG: CRISPR-associated endonuclease Cas2 [Spirochaetales bacterium]|nr:CRISPR-associated endonuclease Cas2 [Spirochaetales bacterium]
MFVILVYDISTETEDGPRRLRKILKVCRQYLHHTQKSVFEGEITEARLIRLKGEINEIILTTTDYVVIYKVDNKNNLERQNIGMDFNPAGDII